MDEARRLLVISAIRDHHTTRGCFEWCDERTQSRIQREIGLPPSAVRQLVIDHVCEHGSVIQRHETRETYRGLDDYWYFVVIPDVDGFPRGLFVEFVLIDDDSACPTVHIVNAHKQTH